MDPAARGLVIRIFGRWCGPTDWVSIVDIPLAAGAGERALRALRGAERDLLPVAPVCKPLLTGIILSQVYRAIGEYPWGELTVDLWARDGGQQRPFELGYEVVEVAAGDRSRMRAEARALPLSGTPGGVTRVPQVQTSLMFWSRYLAQRLAPSQ